MRAKVAHQERLIAAGEVPARSSGPQFFEFLGGIAGPRADGDTVDSPRR